MNRGGAFESISSSTIQQMMMMGVGGGGGSTSPSPSNTSLWNLNTSMMRPAPPLMLPSPTSSTISSSSSSSSSSSATAASVFPQYCLSQPSNLQLLSPNWHDNQEFPESWRQLLLGGLVEEEDRSSFMSPFQTKKLMENWEQNQVQMQAYPPSSSAIISDHHHECNNDNIHNVDHVKKELLLYEKGYLYHGTSCEEIQAPTTNPRSPWSQILPNSSPRSCVTTATATTTTTTTTTSLNSSMLDFSNNCSNKNAPTKHHHQDPSSQECNSSPTGSPYKKARVQASSQSTFKVRKEKLGDRITALHQLVSPFGKTDTASVLLEAIGYIKFLQSQIEALSSPYLATGSANNMKQQQQYAQGEKSCIFPEDPGQLLNDNCMKRIGAPDQNGSDQEPKKDLRSRGLCLVPVSFTMHVGSDNGADYWAPTFGGGFR